ncbi:MAG: N-acetylneuraminate synthase [Lachnospiraceae bacterium]|nr:N-acetylneuraminate synthase [Lachnospiraceae bacterium]
MNNVVIIAEAGVNHNGRLDLALKLVDAAAEAGADYVKFQTFKSNKLTVKEAPKAEYQKQTTDSAETQQDMLKRLELTDEMHRTIKNHCDKKGIKFLSTPFDTDSLEYLVELGVDCIKLSSGDITNYELLRAVGKTGKDVILSTGMSTMEDVEDAFKVLKRFGTQRIILLHCNTQYPTPFSDVNLRAMLSLKEKFGCDVGYSDHTLGTEVPVAAVAMGASVIEKHFTLDKTMDGPDHKASLEPGELKSMVSQIRNIEMALGTGDKTPSDSEKGNMKVARKSIVAKCDISEGECFTEENITAKRPGSGISPMKWDNLIGKSAKKSYKEDDIIDISEL